MKKIKGILIGCITCVMFFAGVGAMRKTAQAAPVRMGDGTIFDAVYYAGRYPDLMEAFGNDAEALWQHFVTCGRYEGRQCTRFDYRYYAETYPDLMAAFGYDEAALWEHYLVCGMREGRLAHLGQLIAGYITQTTTAGTSALSMIQGLHTTPQGTIVTGDEADAMQFLGTSLFIGDSVMAGYGLICSSGTDPLEQSFLFMAAPSYSVTHALNENEGGMHPPYRGKRLPAWQVACDVQPQTIFLSFGINDLTYTSPETFIDKYTTLIQKIQGACPGARIVVLSTTYPYPGVNKVYLNSANVQKINQGMAEVCAENGWTYLDVATPLSDGNGNMRPELSSDGYVHILPAAYTVWTDVIRSFASSN